MPRPSSTVLFVTFTRTKPGVSWVLVRASRESPSVVVALGSGPRDSVGVEPPPTWAGLRLQHQ